MPELATKTTERAPKSDSRSVAEQDHGGEAPVALVDSAPVAAAGDAAQRHASLLGDARVGRMSVGQRANLMRQLQRGYGNGHVARVMAKAHSNDSAIQRKECPPEPAESGVPQAPADDPRFQAVEGKAKQAAAQEKKHAPANAKVDEAQAAAIPPANEVSSKAGANQVGAMDQQQPGTFDKAAFVAKVNEAIAAITPKTEDEAAEFKRNGRAGQVGDSVRGMVGEKRLLAEKAIKAKTEAQPDTGKVTPKPVTPMQAEQAGPPPAGVAADNAMPQPRPPEEVALEHTKCETDSQMSEAGVTEEQLQKSNEPEFNKALDAKQTADAHAAQAPQEFRQQEGAALGDAKGQAQAAGAAGLEGMHAGKVAALGQVTGAKGDTKSQDEAKRAEFAKALEDIYAKTKTDVTAILDGLTGKVDAMFGEGERSARSVFESYVDTEMAAYKKKRYSGWGAALAVTDTLKITSLPPEVNKIYEKGRDGYLKTMQVLIGNIADLVASELNRAKARIAQGRSEIDGFVAKQPKTLQSLAKEAADGIQGKFDQLEQDVDSKQDELVQSLAQKYSEALKSVDDKIAKMKEANKGLLDRAKEAISGVIDTITNLKNMLMGVLAKAAGVIDKIIKDPIGFLGNLVSAIKMGLNRFVDNIGKHLKNGLMGWLFGTLAEGGITLPKSFDLKGILELVLQLLGLTYANIRARAVKIVGEKTIAQIEQAVEVFKILISVGPAGLWEMIKENLSTLKEQAMSAIQDFVITKVVTAGITWLISLLNPASAFVKACKMIYDVVMFFVERASQIATLVNSILDSVGAIANGSLDSAAGLVESSLAKAVPVAISFLASLLGVGGIAEKIKEIIGKIQKPIGNLIDKLVMGAVKGYKKIAGTAKAGFAWAKGAAKKGFTFLKAKAKQSVAFVKAKVKQGVVFVKEKGKQAWDSVKTMAKQGVTWAKATVKKLSHKLKSKVKQGATNIAGKVGAVGKAIKKRALGFGDSLATKWKVQSDIKITKALADASLKKGGLTKEQVDALLKPQGLRGRLANWWLDKRKLDVLYRGQRSGPIMSHMARNQGLAASEKMYQEAIGAGLSREEIAGFTAKWNYQAVPPVFAPKGLGDQPIGSVGIPATSIPGIAKPFSQSTDPTLGGPDQSAGKIYIIRAPRGQAATPDSTYYPLEQEKVFFHEVPQEHIVGEIPPESIPALQANQDPNKLGLWPPNSEEGTGT
jgi:hypothetical protein